MVLLYHLIFGVRGVCEPLCLIRYRPHKQTSILRCIQRSVKRMCKEVQTPARSRLNITMVAGVCAWGLDAGLGCRFVSDNGQERSIQEIPALGAVQAVDEIGKGSIDRFGMDRTGLEDAGVERQA